MVPASAFTEGTFWLTTAMAFGMTIGNVTGGLAVAHRFAGNHLYLVPALFGLVAAGIALFARLPLPALGPSWLPGCGLPA